MFQLRWHFIRIRPACVGWHLVPALLLLALAACAQDGPCDLVKAAQVPLLARNHILAVPVTINGHAMELLLDTGAEASVLQEATVQRLGIARDARFLHASSGIGGASAKPMASIDSMTIGGMPIAIERLPVNTVPASMHVDGLLGVDLLHDYDLDIDAPKRTLTLYSARACVRASPPWSEPAVPITGVELNEHRLRIPIEINAAAGMAVVDTGATTTLLSQEIAGRLGLGDLAASGDRIVSLGGVAGDRVQAAVHLFRTVRVGPVTAHDVRLLVLLKEPPRVDAVHRPSDGWVGQDVLSGRRIWISLRAEQMFVSRRAGDAVAE